MAEGASGALAEAAEKFQKSFDEMVKEVSSKALPLQLKSFECCVKCFDGIREASDWKKVAATFSASKQEAPSPESIAQCVSACHKKSEAFGEVLQREAQSLQQSLEKCQSVCAATGGPSESTWQREKCLANCFAADLPSISEVKARLLRRLENWQ